MAGTALKGQEKQRASRHVIWVRKDLHAALMEYAKRQEPPWSVQYALDSVVETGLKARRIPIKGIVPTQNR
jgi:hypothetical protein